MLAALAAEEITVLPGVPFFYDLISSIEEEHDLSRIRVAYSSGVAMRKPTFDAFLARYGIPIRQAYGATETAMVSINTGDAPAATWDTCGRPVDPVVVEVVPSPDAPAPGVGELFVKTPGLTPGYLDADPASMASFRDGGWMAGDLGYLDEAGFLRLTGRSKLIIEVSGMKVDPVEVEDILMNHPAVAEAAVVGVPDPRTGEQRIKAVVVRKDTATAAEILRFVRGRLTPYKVPSVLEFRDALPRSGSGKVLRGQLID
jgi:long-chain acyl-CoA synthetase